MSAPVIVVVGGSAGAVEALRSLVGGLRPSLRAAVFVATHLPPGGRSRLVEILGRASPLPVTEVRDAVPWRAGHVYMATPNLHLIVGADTVSSVAGPRENSARPSIDVLFRSAAAACGARTIGVILSGALDDGAAGLKALKEAGGLAIVQDPEEAAHASMPLSALRATAVDHVVPAHEIPELLHRLTEVISPRPAPLRTVPATQEVGPLESPPAPFACPECNGTLWAVDEERRYRCRVGHAFSEESLVAENGANLERAVWTALRILEERVGMLSQLASAAEVRGHDTVASMWRHKRVDAEREVDVLRRALANDLTLGDANSVASAHAPSKADAHPDARGAPSRGT